MEAQAKYGPLFSRIYEAGSILTLHRHYIQQFFSQVDLGIRADTKILDAGCGGGRFHASCLQALRKKNRKMGINGVHTVIDAFDISEYMLRIAEQRAKKKKFRDNIRLYKADGCDLSFVQEFVDGKVSSNAAALPDNKYDIVLCSGMLECIPPGGIEKAVKEIARVLKPEGTFIFLYVRNTRLGKQASRLLRFRLIDQDEVFRQFYAQGIRNLKEFSVKSHHPYLKKITGIYIGTKQSDCDLEAEVKQPLNKKEESVGI